MESAFAKISIKAKLNKMSQSRTFDETLKVLKQLESSRGSDYVWTRDELAQVAPYYNGTPKRFNISLYIEKFIQRNQVPERKRTSSANRYNIIEQEPMSLGTAVRTLFHAVCPHPARYYNDEGIIDFDSYNADLGIWLTTVSTTWIQMQDTEHSSDCSCCISFRMLATNYEDMLKSILSDAEYHVKRVSKNTICRWASGLSADSAKEGLENLVIIGKALLTGQDDSRISDLTDLSSELSDAQTGEPSVSSWIPESKKEEMRYDEQIGEEIDEPTPTQRQRRIAPRPLDTVIEVSDIEDVLTLAITEAQIVVHVRIPKVSYTDVGRNEICEYSKTFFRQLVKVKAKLSILELLGQQARTRRVKQMHKAYRTTTSNLNAMLSGTQAVYTTRSRKKQRLLMLHGDET